MKAGTPTIDNEMKLECVQVKRCAASFTNML